MAYDEHGPVWSDDDGGEDSAESMSWRMERDIERAENNPHLRDHLTETERIRLATRQHVIVLWLPVLAVVLAAALFLRAVADGGSAGTTQDFFLWLLFAAVLWLLSKWLWWRRNLFVATDRRILKMYGVLSTTVDSMRVHKVTDMRYRRDFIGELLGYGGITIESAGQEQALHDIRFLPYPRENYQELCHVIFGEAPRSGGRKKHRFRRPLERLAGRRWMPERSRAYPMDYPDHDTVGEVTTGEASQRMLYSSQEHRTAPTGPIPIYPPGFFDGRDDDEGETQTDPTRP
ncbi:PH domain-containing protein [Nostocoides sp. F2B08]|uniref:PH domain-containing protein n=1 Tax=Nostocoides sp. F2B08 TaxID=2653936 RepID=UPI0012638493|nr:PH domain-containing protein [Tetrasphaera sp. F2B08]KAB7743850.1 PH domain-containing protein [Tetrasphaera sp. F2B08]